MHTWERAQGSEKGSDSAEEWWLSQQDPLTSWLWDARKRGVELAHQVLWSDSPKVRMATYQERYQKVNLAWGKAGEGSRVHIWTCQSEMPARHSNKTGVGCLEYSRETSAARRGFPCCRDIFKAKRKARSARKCTHKTSVWILRNIFEI